LIVFTRESEKDLSVITRRLCLSNSLAVREALHLAAGRLRDNPPVVAESLIPEVPKGGETMSEKLSHQQIDVITKEFPVLSSDGRGSQVKTIRLVEDVCNRRGWNMSVTMKQAITDESAYK
jgi:hypothetical protein